MSDTAAADVALVVVQVLERAKVNYALGGALAYGYWAPPRGTHDVDMNVFAGLEALDGVLRELVSSGFKVDPENAREEVVTGGHVKAWQGDIRVDLFFDSIPLHQEAARRAVRVPFFDVMVPVLSAEDLILFKLLFFRAKDLVDVPRMVASQGAKLDRGYVRRWLVDMVGEDDRRTAKWDEFCRELPV